VPIVLHDPTVDRTTDGRGRAGLFTLGQVRRLDAGRGERVPTLDEVLALVASAGLRLNIEIKREAVRAHNDPHGIEASVAAAIRAAGLAQSVVVSSIDPRALLRIHRIAPEIETAVLWSLRAFGPASPASCVARVRARAFHLHHRTLSPRRAANARKHAVPMAVYVVNVPAALRRAVTLGVRGIITDVPGNMRRWVDALPSIA
jgi:glycerophosphoryl diester phosphodiesterase